MTKCIKETFGHFQRFFETPLLIINVLRFFVVRLYFFKCCFIKKKTLHLQRTKTDRKRFTQIINQ